LASSSPAPQGWAYDVITGLFGVGVETYFRRRHDDVSFPDGPLVVVANHPNGIVDPAVVAHVSPRRLRFLGKEPLFRMPVVSWLVKGTGSLPVYRAKDGADTAQNAQMFRAVFDALQSGEAICLFPEGISHNEPQLQPLKTGAARMALGAEAECDFSLGVNVLPVGIVYDDKRKFRSGLSVVVGDVIVVAQFKDLFVDDERAAASALTDAIDDALRELTLHMDAWHQLPLLRLAERIWDEGQDPVGDDETTRLRQLSLALYELQQSHPDEAEDIEAQVAAFADRLDALGLHADDLDTAPSVPKALWFGVRNAVALTVGLPLAVVGSLLFLPPYLLVRVIAERQKERDLIATVALFAGALFVPLWLVVTGAVALQWWPASWVLPAVILAPLLGLFSHRFWRRRRQAWQDLQVFFSFGLRRRLRRQIADQRSALAAQMKTLERVVRRQRDPQDHTQLDA